MVDLEFERPLGVVRTVSVFVPDDMIISLLWDYFRMQLERQGELIPGSALVIRRVSGERLIRSW